MSPPPPPSSPGPGPPEGALPQAAAPRSGVRRRIHAWFASLAAANASPERLAAAVFVGVIAGCTPFFGAHLWLCIALAWLLRLNQITVYAAANVSIPPFVPFLGFASVQIGERLLRGAWLPLSIVEFRRLGEDGWRQVAHRFFFDWLVGGLVVGALLGGGMSAVLYVLARRRRRRLADPVYAAIAAASSRYRAAPRGLRMYALFKYRLDPCYRAIAPLVPEGSLTVDLGTGLGMLPLVLVLLPGERRALGVDWDGPKLDAGRAAGAGLDRLTLALGDARTVAIPPCDVITLVDVLHYYDADAQRALLARATDALRPGGKLLVREGDARRSGSARWTRLVEALAVRIGWNRGDGATRFRPTDELRRELESLGYAVSVASVAGKLHPGNVLLEARRPLVAAVPSPLDIPVPPTTQAGPG